MIYGSVHTHFESDKDAVNAHFGENGRISFRQPLAEFHKLGAKKIAITEHGSFSSFEDIYAASKEFDGLDVIPGVEVYLDYKCDPLKRTHLILIAKDAAGYQQLCKIITKSSQNTWVSPKGRTEYPITTLDMLNEVCGSDKGHLLCTSACIAGVFGRNLGLDFKNTEDRIERYVQKLEKHDYFEKQKDIDAFEELKAQADAMLPSKEEVERANSMKDVGLKKAHTQMRRDAREFKQTADYVEKKERAKAAKKYISSNRLTQSIRLYNEALKEREDYFALQDSGALLDECRNVFDVLYSIFGSDFYFELQNHHLPAEERIYNALIRFALQVKHPQFIASNDIHIAMHKDNPAFAEEVERRNVAKSMRFGSYSSLEEADTYEYGIKTDGELREELLKIIKPVVKKDGSVAVSAEQIVDNAVSNIKAALDKCMPYESVKADHYPRFGEDDIALFEQHVYAGISQKFNGKLPNGEYEERLKKELHVIESMGYASYHLIVEDYLTYGRLLGYLPPEEYENAPLSIEELDAYITERSYPRIGYAIGPGRGSAAGSLVCYLLGITDIDPMRYNLLFERFLNPERNSMPDIDSDFKTDIREKCTQYVEAKYGREKVCKIMTKSYQQSKGCLRLAARYLAAEEISSVPDIGNPEKKAVHQKWIRIGDKLAKMIDSEDDPFAIMEEDETTGDTEYVDDNLLKDLSTDILNAEELECVRIAKLSNGIFSGYGQHAAGVIISKDDISGVIPLMKGAKNNRLQTQCTMATAESKGLLKMDFLGLKNLNIITNVMRECGDDRLQDYSQRDAVLEDKAIYRDIYCTGMTKGIFQFESPGMTNLLKDLQPDCFEDIIAAIALYRPGPMDFIPAYIKGKKDPESVHYICPEVREILQPTYGTIVYQEQVMQIFQNLAGFTMGQADAVRKAMSKKHTDEIEAEREPFIFGDAKRGIEGAVRKAGITEKEANELFDRMIDFGKYAFNKSHATAYAIVSVFTAYLKRYHPAHFYAETLNYLGSRKTKVFSSYVEEMKLFGIDLKAPDFLHSMDGFSVSEDGKSIYFGLGQIKGMSELGNIYRTDCMQEFITKNPGISEKALSVYAGLGMFKTCFIGEKTVYAREKMLHAVPRVKAALDKLILLRAQVQESKKAVRDSGDSKLCEDHKRLMEKYRQTRDETISVFNTVRNMKEPPLTDKKRMERYATEKEYLFSIFSAKEDVDLLKKYPSDFGCLSGENAKESRMAALVLSISSARKTKTSGKTYYHVELMDKNGDVISRRFETPPRNMTGIFLLQPDDHRYFYCRELSALKKHTGIQQIPFSDVMQGIVDGTINPGQMEVADDRNISGHSVCVLNVAENMEGDEKCMELSG